MKYFLFLDESGDHGLVNVDPGFPVFVLCGVLIEEVEYFHFRDKLNSLKNEFWGNKTVILHSRDIRKCDKEFSILLDLELKKKFYEKLNNLLLETSFVIICSAIRKEYHIKRYGRLNNNVYEIALSFIVERSVFFLDTLNEDKLNVQVVIEKRGKKEDQELNRHFQRIKSQGTYFVNSARIETNGFGFHFRNKKDNINGLQLADLIAYPVARFVIDPERANPAFDLIEAKFYKRSGKRFGLKIFP